MGKPEEFGNSEKIYVEDFMAKDFNKPFRIVPIGKYYRGDRVLDITPRVAQEIFNNWKNGLPRYGLQINVEHGADKSQPGSIGRIKEIGLRPDGIYAERVEFSKVGEQLLNEDRYRAVSPEIIWSKNSGALYQDPKTGKMVDNVICGLAITQTPFFGQDVQVFSAKEKLDEGTKVTTNENFDSPTLHQVHVETAQGGNMAKKTKKDFMDAGASEEEAMKKLAAQDAEDKKDSGADEDKEAAAITKDAENFAELNKTIELLSTKLNESEAKHDALVHQFAAERQLRRTVEFVEAAEQFSALPAKQDELGMKLLALYDADTSDKKEMYGYFEGLLKQMNEVSKSSELFTSSGSERFDADAGDPFLASVEKTRAEKFGAEKYEDGYAKAYNLAGSLFPDLARQYVMRNTHIDHK